MARIREGKKPGPVAVRKLAAKKGGPGANSSAVNGGPHPMQGVIALPKRPSVEDVVTPSRTLAQVHCDEQPKHRGSDLFLEYDQYDPA